MGQERARRWCKSATDREIGAQQSLRARGHPPGPTTHCQLNGWSRGLHALATHHGAPRMKEGASSLSGIFAGVESRLELIVPRAPGPARPVFLSCAWWTRPRGAAGRIATTGRRTACRPSMSIPLRLVSAGAWAGTGTRAWARYRYRTVWRGRPGRKCRIAPLVASARGKARRSRPVTVRLTSPRNRRSRCPTFWQPIANGPCAHDGHRWCCVGRMAAISAKAVRAAMGPAVPPPMTRASLELGYVHDARPPRVPRRSMRNR